MASLDKIDGYIELGRSEKAASSLRSLSRSAVSSAQWLGIVRRQMLLGLTEDAEKSLERAAGKLSGNADILAVYVSFLMRQGRTDEALELASRLEKSSFQSVVSELRLRSAGAYGDYFREDGFSSVFENAWEVTGAPAFLRNAAVAEAVRGRLSAAARFRPSELTAADEPLFWALVSYDAGSFFQAREDALDAAGKEGADSERAEALLLAADASLMMNDEKEAVSLWKKTIELFTFYSPVPYFNETLASSSAAERKESVTALVGRIPQFVPGLSLYGQTALEGAFPPAESAVTAAVRSAGFSSLEMEEAGFLPRIPVADALAKMKEALDVSDDPQLLVEYHKLGRKAAGASIEDALIDIWRLLEGNPANEYLYEYAVYLFLSAGRYDEASGLLGKWLYSRYGIENAYSSVFSAERLNGWEREYLAYCCALEGNMEKASECLETLANDPDRSLRSMINLAYLYEAAGNFTRAMDLYGIAAGLTPGREEKALVHYRIGRLYAYEGDFPRAELSLAYSLSLDGTNQQARLLLKKIRNDR